MMKRERNRLIVLSLDAVGSIDLPYMRTLPHFRAFMKRAAGCERVISVYPSLTYPAHTSIMTGLYPANHRIVNNHKIQPEKRKPDWFWQRRYIHGTTLYDEARRSGLKVATLLWPVTGKARIRYNLPEVWANQPWENQISVSISNGTPWYQVDLYRRFGYMVDGVKQPQLDNFVQAGMLYTLRRYQPDVLFAHLTDVDTNRHTFGAFVPGIQDALGRHDRRLGELFSLLGSMGWEQKTNVVVLGDHCQKDVSMAVYPNYWFRRKGWLTAEKGMVKEWRVLARECDGACYIYLKTGGTGSWRRKCAVCSAAGRRKSVPAWSSFSSSLRSGIWGPTGTALLCWRQGTGIFTRTSATCRSGRRATAAACTRPPTGICPPRRTTRRSFLPRDRTLSRGPESAACAWWTRARCWPKSWASALETRTEGCPAACSGRIKGPCGCVLRKM